LFARSGPSLVTCVVRAPASELCFFVFCELMEGPGSTPSALHTRRRSAGERGVGSRVKGRVERRELTERTERPVARHLSKKDERLRRSRCQKINRSHAHAHDREQHPRHRRTHAHDKNNSPNPQPNTSHKHLTTLEGGATQHKPLTLHTNTERATAQRRLIIEVVVAAPKLPPSAALLLSSPLPTRELTQQA